MSLDPESLPIAVLELSASDAPLRFIAEADEFLDSYQHGDYISLGELARRDTGSISVAIGLKSVGESYGCYSSISLKGWSSQRVDTLFSNLSETLQKHPMEYPELAAFCFVLGQPQASQISCIISLDKNTSKDAPQIRIYAKQSDRPFDSAKQPEALPFNEASIDDAVIVVGQQTAHVANYIHASTGSKKCAELAVKLPGQSITLSQEEKQARKEIVEKGPVPDELLSYPTFDIFAGIDEAVASAKDIVDDVLAPTEFLEQFGIKRPRGVLLLGPEGVGKTELSRAITRGLRGSMASIKASEIFGRYVGEPGANLQQILAETKEDPEKWHIILLDEADGFLNRNASGNDGVAITFHSELKAVLSSTTEYQNCLFIFASNAARDIEPSLLRPGRIDRIIKIDKPDDKALALIFSKKIMARAAHFNLDLADTDESVPDFIDLASFAKVAPVAAGDPINVSDLVRQLANKGMGAPDIDAILDLSLHEKKRMARRGITAPQVGHQALSQAIDLHLRNRRFDV